MVTTRRKPATVTSRLLGIAVVLWLNLAVQPCAMAFASDQDCSHCPPAQEDSMAAHHGHHGDKASDRCDSLEADCGDVSDFSFDGRQSQNKFKDKADLVLAVPVSVPEASLDPIGFSTTAADPPRPAGSSRRLHIINCVFLI
jgi:hypothetical protein